MCLVFIGLAVGALATANALAAVAGPANDAGLEMEHLFVGASSAVLARPAVFGVPAEVGRWRYSVIGGIRVSWLKTYVHTFRV